MTLTIRSLFAVFVGGVVFFSASGAFAQCAT